MCEKDTQRERESEWVRKRLKERETVSEKERESE